MGRKYTQAQNKASQKYAKAAYDRLTIRMPKGEREKIKHFFEENGYSSTNQFVLDAMEFYKAHIESKKGEGQ